MRHGIRSGPLALLGMLLGIGTAPALEPGQAPPTRLYTIGDSLTRAANANLLGDNLSASWANGYVGFWQEMFGLPNVHSHNQRITELFGERGRRNWLAAKNGARVDDLAEQAAGVPLLGVTYATVFLGGNDVCRDDPAKLPTDAEFESHVRSGLQSLVGGMLPGGTVLVLGIPNVKALYEVGQTKTFLGITSCPTLWDLTGFCEAMLDEDRPEVDRLYLESRNVGYNRILQLVTDEVAAQHPGKFVRFTNAPYELPHAQDHISDLDCFHLAWRGQRTLSEMTWPF